MSDKNQIIFGLHSVSAALEAHPDQIVSISVLKDRNDKKMDMLLQVAKANNIAVEFSSRHALDRVAEGENHQGVIAFCRKAPTYSTADIKSLLENVSGPPLVLVLDGLQDPHNLGACFRTADAAGVNLIIAPKDRSVGITPTVRKVASGAVEAIPFVQATNLVRSLEVLKELGIWIYGAAAEAEQSLFDTDLTGPAALVLGAEGDGLRRLTREHCDVLVNIPMLGSVGSLNVSVATGIFLFEAVRGRIKR